MNLVLRRFLERPDLFSVVPFGLPGCGGSLPARLTPVAVTFYSPAIRRVALDPQEDSKPNIRVQLLVRVQFDSIK
jgi:hypothetical protein